MRYFLIAASIMAAGSAHAATSTIEKVKERGMLNCGTDDTAPGFGYLNPATGKMEGMDVDMCKAVAAAVLGDASKVNFVHVTAKSRFTALQANLVDVVYDYTTVLSARDANIGIDFLPVYFWDGTGVMVKSDANLSNLGEMEGATLCTIQGSGNETIISSYIKEHAWKAETPVLTFDNLEKVFAALNAGRCNAMITDKSSLAAYRGNSVNPEAYTILPETLLKSPFAGFVLENDSKWRDALSWITYALFQAEESDISQASLEEAKKSADPFVRKFLGVSDGFGSQFGLSDQFAAQTISQVGNYSDIYERNIGPSTPFSIPRKGTSNAAAKDGGLLISPSW